MSDVNGRVLSLEPDPRSGGLAWQETRIADPLGALNFLLEVTAQPDCSQAVCDRRRSKSRLFLTQHEAEGHRPSPSKGATTEVVTASPPDYGDND